MLGNYHIPLELVQQRHRENIQAAERYRLLRRLKLHPRSDSSPVLHEIKRLAEKLEAKANNPEEISALRRIQELAAGAVRHSQ